MCMCVCVYLAMKGVLWCSFLVLHVPHQSHSIRLMGSILVVVVGRHQQLWVLRKTRVKLGSDGVQMRVKRGSDRGQGLAALPEGTSPDR